MLGWIHGLDVVGEQQRGLRFALGRLSQSHIHAFLLQKHWEFARVAASTCTHFTSFGFTRPVFRSKTKCLWRQRCVHHRGHGHVPFPRHSTCSCVF